MRGHPQAVRGCLQKARDSALLAVEVYNKPAASFKSSAYVTFMVIAWTALFHAVFFKRKNKPYYKKLNGRFERVDGEPRHWELTECLRQYYGSDTGNPVRKNLEFFIPLRNKIEHRSLPELDSSIFGECQAMLLNFDECIEKEFGAKWCIRQCLSFALQMYPTTESLTQAVVKNKAARAAAEFVQQYRSSLDPGVFASGKYAFKAFLIQVANHPSQDTLSIQFRNYDKLTEQEKAEVDRLVVAVKYKQPSIANADTIRASEVCERVQKAFGDPKVFRGPKQIDKYNQGWHTKCWARFSARPSGGSANPEHTDTRYCIYDKRHNDYGYTNAWVDFLIDKFKDDKLYEELYARDEANGFLVSAAGVETNSVPTKLANEHAPE
ncbi:hypothetical protein DMTZ50_0490 [Dehalococcoides mccartyi]|uniref:DUF3644 domain-containing protein n=1 Tax=Dehalococcoides mccartyi TaxID=61435 RepID=UPI0015E7D47E|nr:DUF3644 domain-containing protein [Dehalococcoides mccartyi]MBA2084685.1 hypothetical protein [Dehalococcoides mccartyi]